MSDPIYRALAEHLDATPNGFASTESGAELRLLARLFTPEEAALACHLRLSGDSLSDIATRTGLDEDVAEKRLRGMQAKGLIAGGAWAGVQQFALMPFAVGFYEAQLPFMDVEMAELVEQYFVESQGAITRHAPSIHRVIPVGEAVEQNLAIYAYEQAEEVINKARAWGVRDCICRVQQHLIGKGCERPVNNCLTLAPVAGAFDDSKIDRAISKEEALQILHEAEQAGLVHSTGNYRRGNHYICNCCTCCCGVLRGLSEFGSPAAVANSGFLATVDEALCISCGACLERCQFGALELQDVMTVDDMRCVGCGLCASACPVQAIVLRRLPADRIVEPPVNSTAWRKERSVVRGLETEE